MPLYEYRCKKCEHLEEVLQKASDPAPAVCPECGAKKSMEKEVSLTSFQLKGGGWYKDLYSSVPDKGDAKKDKKAKSDKSSDKKSKSKTEKKSSGKKGSSKASGGTKAA
jgi:putative FmdB family regulatory protein